MIKQPSVLIISDFPETRENFRRYLLESKFTFRILVEKSVSASLLLCQQQIDLILFDFSLPDYNALEFLAKLRASVNENCPAVIILGENDVALAVKLIKSGAKDYLVKQQLTKEILLQAVIDAVIKKDIELLQTNQTNQTSCANELAELNQVEQALRESEEKLSFILNNVNVSISRFCVFANREWQYDYYSSGCETIFGYTSQELVADKNLWLSRVLPQDLEQVITPMFEDIFAERKIDYQYRFYHKDGSLRWIRATLTSRRDDIRDVWYVTSVDNDITEQKRAELALQESEALFRGIFESGLIGILLWNLEGQITDANNVFTQMTGYSREELQSGKIYYSDITPKEYHQLDIDKLQLLLKGESYIPYEKEYICKDGTCLPIMIGCAFLPGFTDRGVAFVLDISDQKRLQQEKQRLLATAEAARNQAEIANTTKDEFLAIVSHELRSPLNSILGWAKLMQTRKLDENAKLRALQTIERNAKAQAQLIEDLLDISRMIQGLLRLNMAPVNLINIIEAAIDVVSPLAQIKQINIELNVDNSVGYVSGDFNRLQQIVVNLLTNAVKFTPARGKVEVSLSVNNSSHAQFTVTDTGKGISPDFLPHVFERFRRADSTTTRSKDGLGLGLAIVYNLVELHNGKVTAASPGVGMGATFTVTLPILDNLAPQLPQDSENPEV